MSGLLLRPPGRGVEGDIPAHCTSTHAVLTGRRTAVAAIFRPHRGGLQLTRHRPQQCENAAAQPNWAAPDIAITAVQTGHAFCRRGATVRAAPRATAPSHGNRGADAPSENPIESRYTEPTQDFYLGR